ncbi:MAG: branched-chain amino acid ABC transporter permease [Hyphomicrobiaceae bacterium]
MLVGLIALPHVAVALGGEFYVSLASRMLILALAATSLNLILGFGGMVSFGHAAFLGIGAYTVAILMSHGVTSAWVSFPLAVVASAVAAAAIGAISLRTRGVAFIMITLAFAQMLYFLAVSLKAYGGDDGLVMTGRSTLAPGQPIGGDVALYHLVLAITAVTFLAVWRLVNSRFGHALQAIRENETRMEAVGFAVLRIKLVAFVLAGAVCGLAGALMANHAVFVSPSLMQWTQSGVLMIMVILGGVGHLWGGVVGALAFLALEELLSHYTIHWQFFLGAALLGVVLVAPNGIMSLAGRGRRR